MASDGVRFEGSRLRGTKPKGRSRHIFVTSECCSGHKVRVVRIENTGFNHILLIPRGLKGTNSVPGHHVFKGLSQNTVD